MSDISLTGLAGFVVMVGTFLIALVAVLVSGLIAWFVSKRRQMVPQALVSRAVSGPAAMAIASLGALGWGLNARGETFDEASPYLAAASLAVGVVVSLLGVVRRRLSLPSSRP